ncbi:MAG: gamma-glutamyltransferase [Candidatus Rokubacteria bacterium]|nr:gamma-glutamyltransferase [Candidatus Rokubacteria bacterium]
MVASPHRLASAAGLAVLARGGNAVDAAIAAAATIAVVYPHMNGIGGDNFWLIFDGARGALLGIAAAGRAAAGVALAEYAARFGAAIPPRGGPAALTVPGAVSGWGEAYRLSREALGTPMGWRELLEDAIGHARDGIHVSAGQQRVTAAATDLFGPGALDEVRRTLWPLYHPDRLGAGRFRQPELARSLETIAAGGAEAFYTGELGRRLAAGAAAAGSPLRAADLAEHRAERVEPLRVRYRDGEAATLPPPTQGFAALALLALLDGFDVAALDEADLVHVSVEATKLAFEDRDRYLADPDAVSVPVERCLDPAHLARQRARITRDRALAARPGPSGAGDTVAIVTADAHGNAVCLIQSVYHEFGAGIVAGDTGVMLQNRGAFFSLDPTHPNALAPRKRTAHTLIPSMYLVGGRPRFVYGTMGGEGQPQTGAALLMRMRDRGLAPQAAIEAPRWLYGRTWGEPSKALRLESRFSPAVAAALAARGHDVKVVDAWSDLVGHAQVIRLDDGVLAGGSDPRADGAALAW